MKNTAYIGRASGSIHKSALSCYIKSLLILSAMIFPALICGCNMTESTIETSDDTSFPKVKSVMMTDSRPRSLNALDVFVFEDNALQSLDSYQRIDMPEDCCVEVASREGAKMMFVCGNGQWTREDWMKVNSYGAINEFRAEFSEESQMFPLMTGECRFIAEGTQTVWVELEPLASDITLRSISCDFKGKGYENEEITEVKVYLININSACRLLTDGIIMPEGIMNMGRLDDNDMKSLAEPEMVCRDCPSLRSGMSVNPSISLKCYPNSGKEESPGSPFTRLVIEGMLKGEKRYWPINIGRHKDTVEEGVGRNCSYIYDVTITGKGSGNPDIPVEADEMVISMEVKQWKEREEHVICF